MKSWHLGLIAVILVAYLVGSKYGSYGTMLLSKVGL
jgi:hypothetical protein